MIPLQIVDRYSRAIFELAEDTHQRDAVFHELWTVHQAIENRPKLLQLLQSPLITREEKRSLIEGILGPNSSALSKQFLNLLVDKNRTDLFPFIVARLQDVIRKKQGIQEAIVVTARELHSSILQLLEKALEKSTGKKMLLRSEVNPEILGGIQIRMGNRMIDGSVRTKLDTLETQLRNVKVI